MATAQSPRTVTVTEVASVLLPANSLIESRIFHNLSTTDSIFIGASDVTASGAKEGWEVKAGEKFPDEATNGKIYAVCGPGKTATVKVFEVFST